MLGTDGSLLVNPDIPVLYTGVETATKKWGGVKLSRTHAYYVGVCSSLVLPSYPPLSVK